MHEDAKECSLKNFAEDRIEAALFASYELESLAIKFPQFNTGECISLPEEHIQQLFINRVKELARVVMSALTDDRETKELRKIVGLPEVNYG